MGRKPSGKPPGPVPKIINWEQFEALCGFQCTFSEICSFLKVDKKTLLTKVKENYGEEFSTIYKIYSETGLCSLRRTQFVLAQKNAPMAIHLGKVLLNQRDVIITENHNTNKIILKIPDNGNRQITEVIQETTENFIKNQLENKTE